MSKRFPVWESKALSSTMEKVLEISNKVNEILIAGKDNGLNIDDLPPSVLSTELLHDIAICYIVMYEKLKDYQLIKDGSHKTNNGIH